MKVGSPWRLQPAHDGLHSRLSLTPHRPPGSNTGQHLEGAKGLPPMTASRRRSLKVPMPVPAMFSCVALRPRWLKATCQHTSSMYISRPQVSPVVCPLCWDNWCRG